MKSLNRRFFFVVIQESLRPFCNLSVEDALELLNLVQENIDWTQVQDEVSLWFQGPKLKIFWFTWMILFRWMSLQLAMPTDNSISTIGSSSFKSVKMSDGICLKKSQLKRSSGES